MRNVPQSAFQRVQMDQFHDAVWWISLPLYLLAVNGWLMILRPASPDQQVPEAFTVSEGEAGIVLTD